VNLGLDLSLKLQQKLSFQMIQSLKLLQVPTLQLEQMIRNELEMNPVLEAETEEVLEEEVGLDDKEEKDKEDSEEPADAAEEIEEDPGVVDDDIDWEEFLDDGYDVGSRMSDEREQSDQRFEPTPVYKATLEETLTEQLAEKKLSKKINLLVQFIIGCISDDGYLRLDNESIAEATETDIYDVEEALNVIWGMEPTGVGARNLRECLILQLRKMSMHESLAMRILVEVWDLFEKVKIPDIARKLGVTNREIQEAMQIFKKCNPKPGFLVNDDRASVIMPDLVVEKMEGKWVVMLNDRTIPSLHINSGYEKMVKRGSKTRKEVKEYVREKLNGANWLIRSIEQRKNTMLRVMYAIIEKQPDFFEKGPPNLNPLKLQDVADMVEMHISTISRVTNGKYVQTPHGIFELKYFFTEGLSTDTSSGDVSAEKIRKRIKELVESENQKKPLSDQKISDKLNEENLKVARRTVAKYREQLRILPARLRQKYE